MMRPILVAALLALALTPSADAMTLYEHGKGWCGGTAPVASACQAEPFTSDGSVPSLYASAALICLTGSVCPDGQVTITATASTGTGSTTGHCTYRVDSVTCSDVTVVGVFLAGEEILVSGTATLVCPGLDGVQCNGVPTLAQWHVRAS